MGLLLDLLKGAGGEKDLSSAIARWRQKVSQAAEGVVNSGFLMTRRDASNQVFLGPPGTVQLDQILVPSNAPGLSYDDTTFEYTLPPNGRFDLAFYGRLEDWETLDDSATIAWVNSADAPLVPGVQAFFAPPGSTLGITDQPVVRVVHQTGAVAEVVKLRLTPDSDDVELSVGSYAVVTQLPSP